MADKTEPKDAAIAKSNDPYVKHGLSEAKVFEFLRSYASTGSVSEAAASCGLKIQEAYRIVLLREFQEHLVAYNTLDNQMLDVSLTSAINLALNKLTHLLTHGETVVVFDENGNRRDEICPARLRDVANATDKVFRARKALRDEGVSVARHQAEELESLRERLRLSGVTVVVKGERV